MALLAYYAFSAVCKTIDSKRCEEAEGGGGVDKPRCVSGMSRVVPDSFMHALDPSSPRGPHSLARFLSTYKKVIDCEPFRSMRNSYGTS